MGAQTMANVDGSCGELKQFLKTHYFAPLAVMNFDETRLVKGGNLTTQRIMAAGKELPNLISTLTSTVVFLLTLVAADGWVLRGVDVLNSIIDEAGESAVSFCLERATRVIRRSWPHFFLWNDTGILVADFF